MKILIIEDEPILLGTITERLTKRNHLVISKPNAEEGWDEFVKNKNTIDVILTDIKMPGMGGLGLLEKLRNEKYHTPIIIMTGHGDLELSVKALKLGAFDFILKPFELNVLFSSLEKLYSLKLAAQDVIETHPYSSGELQISVPTQTKYITSMISTMQGFYNAACKIYDIDAQKISLCLQEAMSNAIIHGNLNIPSSLKERSWEKFDELIKEREVDPQYSQKKVSIRYCMANEKISFEVEDQGNGFNTNNLPDFADPMALLCSGRGLIIIKSFMDEVFWNKSGNKIKMIKYLKQQKEKDQ